MALVEVGYMALRRPNGEIMQGVPIYEEIEDWQVTSSGLTIVEERSCNEFLRTTLKEEQIP